MKEKLNWSLANWPKNIGLHLAELGKALSFLAAGKNRFHAAIEHPVLVEALSGDAGGTDISDHLNTLFFFAANPQNKLMVELGTRGGESTRALLAAAVVSDSFLLSVDIDDCSHIRVPFQDKWCFKQESDVEFASGGFRAWCVEKSMQPVIDVLFIDTSHEYEHTKEEIASWSPYLAPNGLMIFHDTNMGPGIYAKLNGTIGGGWNNDRGVIRAVEEFLGTTYDESRYFCDLTNGYRVLHYPWSNGLTVLHKLGSV